MFRAWGLHFTGTTTAVNVFFAIVVVVVALWFRFRASRVKGLGWICRPEPDHLDTLGFLLRPIKGAVEIEVSGL